MAENDDKCQTGLLNGAQRVTDLEQVEGANQLVVYTEHSTHILKQGQQEIKDRQTALGLTSNSVE